MHSWGKAVLLAIALVQLAAQSGPQTAAPRQFDVASVKASDRQYLMIAPQRSGGRISWTTDLWYMIGYAYGMQQWRLSGPIPGSDHIYTVDATMDPKATEDQVRQMFQSLLIDRFKMAAHRVNKDVDGYALTIAKNGPKIREAKEGDPPAELPEWFRKRSSVAAQLEGKVASTVEGRGIGAITARKVSMQQFAEALQRVLKTAVFDQTGLTGKYDFAFQYEMENPPEDTGLPNLFGAMQQLGLKMLKHRAPVEILVVDRIEKVPSEN